MVRRWLFLLLIVALTAGCASHSVISDPSEIETLHGRDVPEIAFWHTYSDEETRLLEQELIPAFQREHPGIRVKPLRLENKNELKNALIGRASAKRGPDVVRMDLSWVPEFAQNGLLEPLDPLPGFTAIRDHSHQGALAAGLYQNHCYSLPLNINTKVAIFNRELLKRAGYDEPPKTMAEVLDLARRHRFTIGIGGWDGWNTLPYLYSLGAVMTNGDYTKASGYLNGAGTVRAVEQLRDLYKEKLIDLSAVPDGGDNWAGVQGGTVLMTGEGPWFYSVLNESERKRALQLTAPVPFPRAGGSASILSGENLVILKGSKRQNEAWTFLKWMTGKEAQLVMSRTGLIPTNREAAEALEVNNDSFISPYAEALQDTFLRPPVKNWSKIDGVYTYYLQKIFRGELSVQDGLDRAAAEIDRLLEDRS